MANYHSTPLLIVIFLAFIIPVILPHLIQLLLPIVVRKIGGDHHLNHRFHLFSADETVLDSLLNLGQYKNELRIVFRAIH